MQVCVFAIEGVQVFIILRTPNSPAPVAWKWGSRERSKGWNFLEKASRGGERAGHREDQNMRVQGVVGRQRCEAGLFSLLHKHCAYGKVNWSIIWFAHHLLNDELWLCLIVESDLLPSPSGPRHRVLWVGCQQKLLGSCWLGAEPMEAHGSPAWVSSPKPSLPLQRSNWYGGEIIES